MKVKNVFELWLKYPYNVIVELPDGRYMQFNTNVISTGRFVRESDLFPFYGKPVGDVVRVMPEYRYKYYGFEKI